MFFSSINVVEDMKKYPEAIQTAITYLKSCDFTTVEPGTYEIQGKDIYAMVMDAQTGTLAEKRPEVHAKYIDVQFLVTGRERLGFTPDTGAYEVVERREAKDTVFYGAVEHESFIEATPGCFSVFFPEDVHRPNVAVGEPTKIRKVVVKVSVDLI